MEDDAVCFFSPHAEYTNTATDLRRAHRGKKMHYFK
jgi:hypothetical protein